MKYSDKKFNQDKVNSSLGFIYFMTERDLFGYPCGPYVKIGLVKDNKDPNKYLLAIECDGAAYHSSYSARARDRLRQEVLEGLGWKVYRIWSTDWFRDPKGELDKLEKEIQSITT